MYSGFHPGRPEIGEIATRIVAGNCTLFVGAGLSIAAGLPSWGDLVLPLRMALVKKLQARGANPGPPDRYDALTWAQAYEREFDPADLRSKVCQSTDARTLEPTKVHKMLPALGIRTWITTNYDDLLERALTDSGDPPRIVIRDPDIANRDDEKVCLVKLHGDRTDPNSVLLTKNDLFGMSQTKPNLWTFLRNELTRNSVLYLGYSMSDPDFNQVQAGLLHLLGWERRAKSYSVMFGCDEVTRLDCESRNISVVDLGTESSDLATDTLEAFLKAIAERVKQTPKIPKEPHGGSEARQRVPPEKQAALAEKGYPLLCCIEYRTYTKTFDDREFSKAQSGWSPNLPNEYGDERRYLAVEYERWDEAEENGWRGWAIGKRRRATD